MNRKLVALGALAVVSVVLAGLAAVRLSAPAGGAPGEYEAYVVLSLKWPSYKGDGGAYVEITQEDLDTKPLLARVLSAFYDPEADPNARKDGDTLYYGTTEADAVDLKDYIEGLGGSVIKYGEDLFQFGVLLT